MADIDELQEITNQGSGTKNGFFNHVFNYDDNTKNTVTNLIQYVIIGIIPVIVLNKTIQNVFPSPDETKENFEILIEVVGQLIIIFISLLFIHRVITYVPTYSKTDYLSVNIFSVVLPLLVILLSLQTKVGKKVDILFNRVMNFYSGEVVEPPSKEETEKNTHGQHQQSRADNYLTKDEGKMVGSDMRPVPQVPPRNLPALQQPQQQQRQMSAANSPFAPPQQTKPDFNNIYEPFVSGSGFAPF